MPTIIEKILSSHAGRELRAGDVEDVHIDVRVARDFGGANVVRNMRRAGLSVEDPARTYFTFDCNPGGSDQRYATNQQLCREFAREEGVTISDIDRGIGTHLAIDLGLAVPGSTLVSTDSHANLLGAIGAFGQGMGDLDVAHAFAHGKVWFRVPPTVRIVLRGAPSPTAEAKDLALALLCRFGAAGLLGRAAEVYGPAVDALLVDGRITLASMATEMGAIIALIPPNGDVLAFSSHAAGHPVEPVFADADAEYEKTVEIDVQELGPLVSRPGHPDDVIPVEKAAGVKIGSAFLGSCTNGRFSDLARAARILEGRTVAPGVVLKVVPATDDVYRRCLAEGVLATLKRAGALVANAGCAGCAAGQVGQNGPGEVTVSSGNRNFTGKQGKGDVWLASPSTVAASAIAGAITSADRIPDHPVLFHIGKKPAAERPAPSGTASRPRPETIRGRVILVPRDNVDTDQIYHNRHLAVVDPEEMGRYAFGNLEGYENFPDRVRPGDIVVAGENFGCGSSRQQAVDCLSSLSLALLVARSFGAIYERNAVNSGFPILTADLLDTGLADGDEIEVEVGSGRIRLPDGREIAGTPWSKVQLAIYRRGGLLG